MPLVAMLRHRAARGSAVDARAHALGGGTLYREEIARLSAGDGLAVHQTLTREQPEGWRGFARRVDAEMLSAIGPGPDAAPRIFVCGPTAFVERAADLLVALGHDAASIRVERFGPTGG